MSEQNQEHLAFVAVMNALDVHMPPDGAALLTELRAIAATVGYPWRGAPLPAGPVAPPPDLEKLIAKWRTKATWLKGQESPDDALKMGDFAAETTYTECADELAEALGEAQRGAARPPQPPEDHHGTGLALPALRETNREGDTDTDRQGDDMADAVCVTKQHADGLAEDRDAHGRKHDQPVAHPPARKGDTNEPTQTPVSSLHAPIRDPLCPPLHDGGDGLRDTGPMGTGRVGPPASPPALDPAVEAYQRERRQWFERAINGDNDDRSKWLEEYEVDVRKWLRDESAVPPEAPPP